MTTANPSADAALAAVVRLCRTVHRQPELSGAEVRTAALVAQTLDRLGFAVTSGVGGHGVVATLDRGPGPVVLLRAELDALPVTEHTGLPYSSRTPGVMHACGHDVHLAALLGACAVLAARAATWHGTVVAVAQPAEETLTGAAAMLADGLYERWPRPDVVLAQHLAPLPAGVIAHGPVPTRACAQLRVRVTGAGGHGGDRPGPRPDALTRAVAIHRLLEQHADNTDNAVDVAVCSLRAGASSNVRPDEAVLLATVRAPRSADVVHAVDALRRRVGDVTDASSTVEITGSTDAVRTDDAVRARTLAAHRARFGATAVLDTFATGAADDLAELGLPRRPAAERVPIGYWMLGALPRAGWRAATATPNHSPHFAPDLAPTVRAGVAALSDAALAHLGAAAGPSPSTTRKGSAHEARHLTPA